MVKQAFNRIDFRYLSINQKTILSETWNVHQTLTALLHNYRQKFHEHLKVFGLNLGVEKYFGFLRSRLMIFLILDIKTLKRNYHTYNIKKKMHSTERRNRKVTVLKLKRSQLVIKNKLPRRHNVGEKTNYFVVTRVIFVTLLSDWSIIRLYIILYIHREST